MDLISIYGLTDSQGQIRYVGKSKNPAKRLKIHLQPAQLSFRTRKNSWIKSLLGKGEKPGLVILSAVPEEEANDEERKFIRLLAANDLVNGTLGGDGGAVTDPAALARISAAHLGKKLSVETRQKMSISAKVRCSTPQERARLKAISNGVPPVHKGTAQHSAKLNDEQVLEIRRRHSEGMNGVSLAKMFDVTPMTISYIVRGKTWTHLLTHKGVS